MTAVSDWVGLASAALLAVPPVRDQWGRWREAMQKRGTVLPGVRATIRQALADQRNGFNGLDSALTLLGTLLLIATFVLKLLDL